MRSAKQQRAGDSQPARLDELGMLHRLAERLDLATRAAHMGVWDWDIRQNELVWDDRMYALYGLKRGDFAGAYEAWLYGLHPDDRAASDAISAQARRGECAYDTEFRVVWPDGSIHVLKAYGDVVRDADGTPLRMIGVNFDITEHKRAEEALRESEARYRLISEHSADVIWTMDLASFRFTYVSPSVQRLRGYTAEEVLAQPVAASLTPEANREVAANLAPRIAAFEAGDESARVYITEIEQPRKDGSIVPTEVVTTLLSDAQGRVSGVLGVSRDITARRRIEAALRESERRTRNLLEHVPIGMFQSTHDGRLIYVNPAYAAMMGYASPEELIEIVNQSSVARALYEDPARHPLLVSEVEQAQGGWKMYENRYRCKSGQIIDAILTFSERIDPISGQPALFGFVQDITARKRAEAALLQVNETLEQRVADRTADLLQANAELARAGRLKDEFLATMSHELRTPLNAILGRAELLREELYGPLAPRQIGAVHGIETSGRHLLALINDILDLSSIEAGRLHLRIGPVAVESVCQLSVHLVAESAKAKQIALSVTIDPQVAALYADERRLTQILVNLLANAVKFTPGEGAVGLEVRGDAERHTITFTVWDTGIGIAEENLPRLFQPFVQIDSGLNRQYEGTGLGLSLVRRLTEAHQGWVGVESALGYGSRFSVTLPWSAEPRAPTLAATAPASACPQRALRRSAAPLSTAQATTPEAGAARPRILLVDDSTEHRQIIKDYLQAHGYAVRVAHNGLEALAMAREEPPAFVLMDIQMPKMDGLEAIRRLRDDARLRAVPVLALTALAMPDDRKRCLDAGATAYLSKPIRLQDLLATIRAMLVEQCPAK
ncbi:MAG: PAS domain S-box protein [Chloroflexales bacterium]|nr:PAS domain S-box protein [Chloroflexales bacterium]